jgi:3-isopropylmalate/(R)-2-methylmalate dehydratase small subunit
MRSFITHQGIVAPLMIPNIDTDMIIPKQFLKTVKRSGLGEFLFYEMRFDEHDQLIGNFILNQPAYSKASIILAEENFGCGSSREHAPWALEDFGIRAIIAPSFADIFYNNCFKNGILPIIVKQDIIKNWATAAQNNIIEFNIDLEAQTITDHNNQSVSFVVDAFRKHCLQNGLDDIGLTLEKVAYIDDYENKRANTRPWL